MKMKIYTVISIGQFIVTGGMRYIQYIISIYYLFLNNIIFI